MQKTEWDSFDHLESHDTAALYGYIVFLVYCTDNYDSAACYKDSVFIHLVSRLNVPSRRDRRAPSLKIMVCLGVIFYFESERGEEVSERCTHRKCKLTTR